MKLDLVDRLVAGTAPLLVKNAIAIDETVGRRIKLGGVALERVRRELLDIDLDRGGQPLRAQRIVFRRASGELATLSEVQSDPSIVERLGAGLVVDGVPYPEHFGRLEEFRPTFIRMEKQRPL